METRSAKRRRTCIGYQTDGIDRISNLPDDVLHKILLLLPIRTIAGTSIVSRRWNYLWFSLPDLDFTTIDLMKHRNPIKTINELLSARDRNVGLRTLRLCAAKTPFTSLLKLMRLAVSHGVQELDVKVYTSDYFNFPRCVIANRSLRVFSLESVYPGFRLPPSCALQRGFASLTSLTLSLVNLYDQPRLVDSFSDPCFPSLKKLHLETCFGLKQLRVSCKLLEEFNLMNCIELNELEVAGSRLKRMKISRCFDVYVSENWLKIDTPELESLNWDSNTPIAANCLSTGLISLQEACIGVFMFHKDVDTFKVDSLVSILMAVSNVKTLILEQHCLEILSSKIGITRFYEPFLNLKSLELRSDFTRNDILGLVRLFKNCPTLHKFIFNINNELTDRRTSIKSILDIWSETEFSDAFRTGDLDSFLNHLNVVEIRGFLERQNEVSLVMFLLKYGKALTEITLRSDKLCRDSFKRRTLRSQIMKFSAVYSNAKLSFQ